MLQLQQSVLEDVLDRLDIVLKEQDDDKEKLDSFEDDSFDEEYVDEDVWDVEK